MDLQVLLRRADVDPVAPVDGAEDAVAAREEGGEEDALDRRVHPGRHHLEDARLEDVDPRVDVVRRDLLGPRLLEEAQDPAVGVRLDEAVGRRVRHRCQQDRGLRLRGLVPGDDRRQVDVGQHVAVQDDGPLVEEVERVADGAAGAERGVLDGVADAHAERTPVAEDGLDALRAVGHGEDDLAYPGAGEQVELVAEERPVDDRHDGLRRRERQGSQPRPLAAGQDDSFHQVSLALRGAQTGRDHTIARSILDGPRAQRLSCRG